VEKTPHTMICDNMREKQLPKNGDSWEHKEIHIHYKILAKDSRKSLSRKEKF